MVELAPPLLEQLHDGSGTIHVTVQRERLRRKWQDSRLPGITALDERRRDHGLEHRPRRRRPSQGQLEECERRTGIGDEEPVLAGPRTGKRLVERLTQTGRSGRGR